MRKKRILFVTRAAAYGGAEKHLIDFILRLDASRAQATILCFEADPYSQFLNKKHGLSIPIVIGLESGGLLDFCKAFRPSSPDLIVFVNGGFGAFPWHAYLAARLCAHRVCAIEHLIANAPPPRDGLGRGWLGRLRALAGWNTRYMLRVKLAARICYRTICVSNAIRRRLVEEYEYPEATTITVRNGIDLDRFKGKSEAISVRHDLGINSSEKLILSVARLAKVKGLDVLVNAVALVAKKYPSCKCVILGDGPLRSDLEEIVHKMDLSGCVILAGFKQDVTPYLQAADIFVLPSYKEGLPLSVLEAMACGVPCVATDVGGTAEAITHEHDGLLVRPGDPEQLAQAVLRLLSDDEQRRTMGSRGRQKVEQFFDIERSMDEIRKVMLN